MEIILFILAGFGVVSLFKQNTERGLRVVRANMFLLCIETGDSVHDANQTAMYFNSETVTPTVIYAARNRCKWEYNGNRMAMVQAARRAGFLGYHVP